MRLLGQLEHGIYADDCNGLSVDEINSLYGTEGPLRKRHDGQTGAGHPSDESDDSEEVKSMEADDEDSDESGGSIVQDEEESSMNSSSDENMSESESDGDMADDENESGSGEFGDNLEEHLDRILSTQELEDNIHHEAADVPEHTDPFDNPENREAFLSSLEILCKEGIIPGGYGLHMEEWGEDGYPSFEVIHAGRRSRKELRISLPDAVWRPRAELWAQAHHVMSQIHYMNDL